MTRTNLTTWRQQIDIERQLRNDGPIIACTLTETELDTQFNPEFGHYEGAPFTAWSEQRVYFPEGYDGAEGATSVPRHPCDEATEHQGGGG